MPPAKKKSCKRKQSTPANPDKQTQKRQKSKNGGNATKSVAQQESGKLSASARRFVLKSIAEYQPYELIAQELKDRYGFERSVLTLRGHYGSNAQYKLQIQAYRDRFNSSIADEALASRRHVIQRLERAINKAEQAGDYKGMASLIAQLRDMLGYKVATEIEVNHNHVGGMTHFQRIKELYDNRQTPPSLTNNPMPLLPGQQTVDIQVE